jgi:hypothetical protein
VTARRSIALAGLALTGAVLLVGCSRGDASDAPTDYATTGSAVSVSEDVTAMCDSIVSQQLPLEAAVALAEGSGYTTRITSQDGTPQPATADFREDRLNFEVESDIVTACTGG